MLTRKEKQVLDIIENFIEKHHYSPTFEEIAHALGIKSKSTI
ncbi:LexA family protein, partial [Fangia hongkongensis]